jgi:capsular polysaccharide transport system permease protein
MSEYRTGPAELQAARNVWSRMGEGLSRARLALKTHADVIGAVVIRDIHAKMLGNKFSYLKIILFPLGHLLYLSLFYAFLGKGALLGTDRMVFFASGILPFMIYLYPVRSIVMSIMENKSLLMFPVVHPIDLVLGRSLLEMVNSFVIIMLLFLLLYMFDFQVVPKVPFETLSGILMTMIFTVSYCIPNAIIAAMVHNWVQFCVLYCIMLYISSGALFLPSHLPKSFVDIMYFNPLAHCVEWVRSGYYETYNEGILDKSYLAFVILLNLLVGLVLERIYRGRLNN